jgi:hypothetical protein
MRHGQVKHSRGPSTHPRIVPRSGFAQDDRVRRVEFSTDDDDNNITLKFQDKTALSFDIHPEPRFSIMADYADWTPGDLLSAARVSAAGAEFICRAPNRRQGLDHSDMNHV